MWGKKIKNSWWAKDWQGVLKRRQLTEGVVKQHRV